jgi:hypothetical protein
MARGVFLKVKVPRRSGTQFQKVPVPVERNGHESYEAILIVA